MENNLKVELVLSPHIVIGRDYNYYDDGKIKPSRKMKVHLTEIIPFSEIDSEILALWTNEVEQCDWLYSNETDYFIKGILSISNVKTEEVFFVRMVRNNWWFSIGQWAGILDYDGTLTARLYLS